MLGGEKYEGANLAIMIMAFYPMHQTFGRLNGSFFLATDNTKLYSNIGIIFLVIGLPFTFFVLAPSNLYGLELSSLGLAIKMVIIQIIGVNIEIWFISKKLNFSFFSILTKQFVIVFFLGLFALLSLWFGNYYFDEIIPSFFLSGIIYSLLVVTFIFLFPNTISVTRDEIKNYFEVHVIRRRKNC